MNCPFCQQWNPQVSRRCTFCGNLLDGQEDVTASGRPQYQVTKSSTSMAQLPALEPDRSITLPLSPRTMGYVIAGVVVLGYLLLKSIGC